MPAPAALCKQPAGDRQQQHQAHRKQARLPYLRIHHLLRHQQLHPPAGLRHVGRQADVTGIIRPGTQEDLRTRSQRLSLQAEHRSQLGIRITPRSTDTLDHLGAQRLQGPVTPLRPGRDEDHAVRVGYHQLRILASPRVFQRIDFDLHDDHAKRRRITADRIGKVIAPPPGGRTECVVAACPALHRLDEIRPESEIAADEGQRLLPVAGGQRHPMGIHQIDIERTGYRVDVCQEAVRLVLQGSVLRRCQQRTQPMLVSQQRRQIIILVQLACEVRDVEVQLLAAVHFELCKQRIALDSAHIPGQSQHQPGQQPPAEPGRRPPDRPISVRVRGHHPSRHRRCAAATPRPGPPSPDRAGRSTPP